jgi:putative nucleotidyltransferase with HDIG domain
MQIDLRQAIYALSDMLDLVGVEEVHHGKRVGFMAWVCGETLGYSGMDLEFLFHAALLHDCGVSSTRTHQCLVDQLLWEGAEEHCLIGAHRLQEFPAFYPMGPIIRFHHTPWTRLQTENLTHRDAQFANLVFLLDRVDAMMSAHLGKDLLFAKDEIRNRLKELSGELFAQELVALFLDVSSSEAFWISMEYPHLQDFLFAKEKSLSPILVTLVELKQLARIFADIVDAKSRYTAEHSLGVARLARHLAEQAGLDNDRCIKVEIAGLLHDLGKLRIPDEILETTGSLDPQSRSTMLRHSFETYQILRRIDGMEEIAQWAAYHHERLDGNGYPFHCKETDLPCEARIIAVADVFQALAQNRPYRLGKTPAQIVPILRNLAQSKRLDSNIVELATHRPEQCWEIATTSH